MNGVILSSTYFGPIQWYEKLNRADVCFLESHDHYIKQTYRNRCRIAMTQGVQTLSVPIEQYDGLKCPMMDIRISDHGNWRHVHWNALQSAYGESPFFEFYADDLLPFFTKKWTYLFDFNLEITMKMCELLDIQPTIKQTTSYVSADNLTSLMPNLLDMRDAIHPKHPMTDNQFMSRKYYQVYQDKHGFLPNLSILDLLMNVGNEAILYL